MHCSYGLLHPFASIDVHSLSEAVDAARARRKPLAVYLHNDASKVVEHFATTVDHEWCDALVGVK